MLNAKQFKHLIIKPALEDLLIYSDDAVSLLIYTSGMRSNYGTYLKQPEGSGLGIYGMTAEKYNDIWHNYILNNNPLRLQLIHSFDSHNIASEERLIYDLRYATAMAMIQYMRALEPIPDKSNSDAMAAYYANYF